MMRTMQLMQSSQSKEYQYTIIPTMYDKRTKASLEAYKTLRATYDDTVWPGVIPIDTKFRDASLAMKSPIIYCPKARGVYAYMTLLEHLLKLDTKTCSEAIDE